MASSPSRRPFPVTGDRYLLSLLRYVDGNTESLHEGTITLKLNPVGLHYVVARLESLRDLEALVADAPVDYLRAYVADLGDHRALEQLRRLLRPVASLKVVSVLPSPARDPTPLSLLPFTRLSSLELRGCDLSTSAARGLLELRHCLERIVCHNSTDALRHIFASRISEIKDSLVWDQLSFVSCACNGLVLMDESLQLLPAVETLDLSRNRFVKVDNLGKCLKLQHLDLGFNHLKSISSLSEVSSRIVKLVLRNNSLTSLQGIEKLRSLVGLDLSYNIISSFSELEIVSTFSCLEDLWLEGNPICWARWYRAHVFSFFPDAEKVRLDDKRIDTKEYWEINLIFASRRKQPGRYGIYFPAHGDSLDETRLPGKRKKSSRVASIKEDVRGSEEAADLVSCDSEDLRKEDVVAENESKITTLMTRAELMKEEKSVVWVREFSQWMNQSLDNAVSLESTHAHKLRHEMEVKGQQSCNDFITSKSIVIPQAADITVEQDHSKFLSQRDSQLVLRKHAHPDTIAFFDNDVSMLRTNGVSLAGESESVELARYELPPRYEEDILHHRLHIEHDVLQQPADSNSAGSSDTSTSCSDDNSCELCSTSSEDDCAVAQAGMRLEKGRFRFSVQFGRINDHNYQHFVDQKVTPDYFDETNRDSVSSLSTRDNTVDSMSEIDRVGLIATALEKEKVKRKPKKRIIPLFQHNYNNVPESGHDIGNIFPADNSQAMCDNYLISPKAVKDEHVIAFFNRNVADYGASEACEKVVYCEYVLQHGAVDIQTRKVALLRSSKGKFYVLLIEVTNEGQEVCSEVLGGHKLGDVKKITVGLGLQVVRLCIPPDPAYVFLTRSAKTTEDFLCLWEVSLTSLRLSKTILESWEKVQLCLFEEQVLGNWKTGIFFYSIIFQQSGDNGEEAWATRSLFIVQDYILVCVENIRQFGSSGVITGSSSLYYSLEFACSIKNVTELLVKLDEKCLSLALSGPQEASDISGWKRFKWCSEQTLVKFVSVLKAMHAETSVVPLTVKWVP